jgi:hypothetical protein
MWRVIGVGNEAVWSTDETQDCVESLVRQMGCHREYESVNAGSGDLINDYERIRGHEKYRPDLGLLYLVTMDPADGRLQQLELVPVRIYQSRLAVASTEERIWLQKTLTREGESMGTAIEGTDSECLFVRW